MHSEYFKHVHLQGYRLTWQVQYVIKCINFAKTKNAQLTHIQTAKNVPPPRNYLETITSIPV